MNAKAKARKGGRPSVADRTREFLSPDDFEQSILTLDEELRKELESAGLAYRWINARRYKESGNFHKAGWRAYRRDVSADRGSLDFNYGTSPEGYLIRGDLVLAVKPKENQERYRAHLRAKAAAYSGKTDENVASFREEARRHGAKVFEGYEENE